MESYCESFHKIHIRHSEPHTHNVCRDLGTFRHIECLVQFFSFSTLTCPYWNGEAITLWILSHSCTDILSVSNFYACAYSEPRIPVDSCVGEDGVFTQIWNVSGKLLLLSLVICVYHYYRANRLAFMHGKLTHCPRFCFIVKCARWWQLGFVVVP